MKQIDIFIWECYILIIEEVLKYFCIGENKL